MTPKATVAFAIYRDLGPSRTLAKVAAAVGSRDKTHRHLKKWSSRYEWVRLCAEHDHRDLRESLGKREVVRERSLQSIIDLTDEMVQVLYSIATDASQLPILDRHGKPELDQHGQPMFKPLVKPSTRAAAAQHLLAVGGLVPVKRTEVVDRTGEALDAVAGSMRTMSTEQLEWIAGMPKGTDE